MRLLYAAASYVVFALVAPLLLLHRKLRCGRRQRFGHLQPWRARAARPIWLHGASAGDILALLPTARALRRLRPDVPIVVSTFTNSGHAMATRHADAFDQVFYCPWDLPHTTRRACHRLRPAVLVLEYTELWPHLIWAAKRVGAQVVLHNGRFGRQHLRRYHWLFALTGNLLAALDVALLRDADERERALALGAQPARLAVTGNTKFDNVALAPAAEEVARLRHASGFAAGALVWAAGSTHEGEEALLLQTFVALRRNFPKLKLLLAPRYPDRASKLVAACRRLGLRVRLRHPSPVLCPKKGDGDVDGDGASAAQACDVFVLNSVGELPAAYVMATAVFVGGSFVTRGGQNILEPAACGRPVLFGPYMDNFADAVAVLVGRGGVQLQHPEQLTQVLRAWLSDLPRCRHLGALAQAQVHNLRGAAARNATCLVELYAKVV